MSRFGKVKELVDNPDRLNKLEEFKQSNPQLKSSITKCKTEPCSEKTDKSALLFLIRRARPIMSRKIQQCKFRDQKHGLVYDPNDYIDLEWLKNELLESDGQCPDCEKILKLRDWERWDPDQWTIIREDQSVAFIKDNCRLSCLDCYNYPDI